MQEKEHPERRIHSEPHAAKKTVAANAQPFSEHVRELRQRLLYCIAALLLGSTAGYAFHDRLFKIIRRPLHSQLYYTTPTGGFNAVIKISILFGIIVTVPVFVYQLGKFLGPAFKHRIRAMRIILFSTFLATCGVLFAYYLSLPASLHFLANIDSKNLQSLITVNEYLNFVFAYLAGFAILFQLPLILLFINRIKPQKPGRLMRYQRWVILISFIIAAILTPTPDPINQTIMALPLILLYQCSVMLIWFANRRRKFAAIEPVYAQPEPPAKEPAGYSTSTYSGATPFPSLSPRAIATTPPEARLIMDIFRVPQSPPAQTD